MRAIVMLVAFVLASSLASAAEEAHVGAEATIRQLDLAEADAVLRADFETVDALWAPDMTVNNPFNQVVEARAGPLRTGAVTYASFERTIESVRILGDTAITMGNEVVVPSGTSLGAGTTIRRRYTNVWMQRNGVWLLVARHASIICSH